MVLVAKSPDGALILKFTPDSVTLQTETHTLNRISISHRAIPSSITFSRTSFAFALEDGALVVGDRGTGLVTSFSSLRVSPVFLGSLWLSEDGILVACSFVDVSPEEAGGGAHAGIEVMFFTLADHSRRRIWVPCAGLRALGMAVGGDGRWVHVACLSENLRHVAIAADSGGTPYVHGWASAPLPAAVSSARLAIRAKGAAAEIDVVEEGADAAAAAAAVVASFTVERGEARQVETRGLPAENRGFEGDVGPEGDGLGEDGDAPPLLARELSLPHAHLVGDDLLEHLAPHAGEVKSLTMELVGVDFPAGFLSPLEVCEVLRVRRSWPTAEGMGALLASVTPKLRELELCGMEWPEAMSRPWLPSTVQPRTVVLRNLALLEWPSLNLTSCSTLDLTGNRDMVIDRSVAFFEPHLPRAGVLTELRVDARPRGHGYFSLINQLLALNASSLEVLVLGVDDDDDDDDGSGGGGGGAADDAPEQSASQTRERRLHLPHALPRLRRLDVRSVPTAQFPREAPLLDTVTLRACGLTAEPLSRLLTSCAGSLRVLDASGNRIRRLPEAALLKCLSLEHANFSACDLRAVSAVTVAELGARQALGFVELGANPLRTPPPEVVAAEGWSGCVRLAGDLLRSGSRRNRRCMMQVVGLGEVGKTSMLQALWSPSNTADHIAVESGRTFGVSVSEWVLDDDDGDGVDDGDPTSEPLTISVWDMAGQKVFLRTHSHFMTASALYVLVWRPLRSEIVARPDVSCARCGQPLGDTRRGYAVDGVGHLHPACVNYHALIKDWIERLQLRVPGARVVLVATHADAVTEEDLADQLERVRESVAEAQADLESDLEALGHKGSAARPILDLHGGGHSLVVSSRTGRGIPELRQALAKAARGLGFCAEVVPGGYAVAAARLRELAAASTHLLPWPAFASLCAQAGLQDAGLCLAHLQRSGQAMRFGDTVCTDPLWVVGLMRAIVTHDATHGLPHGTLESKVVYRQVVALSKRGILDRDLLDHLWRDVDRGLFPALLRLFQDLGVLLPDRVRSRATGKEIYLVPGMLPEVEGSGHDRAKAQNAEQQPQPQAQPKGQSPPPSPAFPFSARVVYPLLPDGFLLRIAVAHDIIGQDEFLLPDGVSFSYCGRTTVLCARRDDVSKVCLTAAPLPAMLTGVIRGQVVILAQTRGDLLSALQSVATVEAFYPGLVRMATLFRCPGPRCAASPLSEPSFHSLEAPEPGATFHCQLDGSVPQPVGEPEVLIACPADCSADGALLEGLLARARVAATLAAHAGPADHAHCRCALALVSGLSAADPIHHHLADRRSAHGLRVTPIVATGSGPQAMADSPYGFESLFLSMDKVQESDVQLLQSVVDTLSPPQQHQQQHQQHPPDQHSPHAPSSFASRSLDPREDPGALACPLCMAEGVIPPHYFDADVCISAWRTRDLFAPCPLGRLHSRVELADLLAPQVFLSYSWGPKGDDGTFETQELVGRFKAEIESDEDRLLCWMDRERMTPGVSLDETMRDGVARARVVVVFLDETYLGSKNCRTEFLLALSLKKHIIPVLLPGYERTREKSMKWWPRAGDGVEVATTDTRSVPFGELKRFGPPVSVVEGKEDHAAREIALRVIKRLNRIALHSGVSSDDDRARKVANARMKLKGVFLFKRQGTSGSELRDSLGAAGGLPIGPTPPGLARRGAESPRNASFLAPSTSRKGLVQAGGATPATPRSPLASSPRSPLSPRERGEDTAKRLIAALREGSRHERDMSEARTIARQGLSLSLSRDLLRDLRAAYLDVALKKKT